MERITYQIIKKEYMDAIAENLTMQEYYLLLEGKMQGITARSDDETTGILLFREAGDRLLMLERIEVKEAYRRQGIGTGMMRIFCERLRAAEMNLLISFEAVSEDTEFFLFLKSLQAFYIEEETGFEALLSAEEVASVCKTFTTDKVTPKLYFDQSRGARQEFADALEQGYPLIAWELKHMPQDFRQDLCCCEMDKNGNIQAVCLMKEYEEELELSFLYARESKGTLAAKALIGSINQFHGKEPLPLRMSVVNESAVNILKHMSKHYEITKRGYIAYYLGE